MRSKHPETHALPMEAGAELRVTLERAAAKLRASDDRALAFRLEQLVKRLGSDADLEMRMVSDDPDLSFAFTWAMRGMLEDQMSDVAGLAGLGDVVAVNVLVPTGRVYAVQLADDSRVWWNYYATEEEAVVALKENEDWYWRNVQ